MRPAARIAACAVVALMGVGIAACEQDSPVIEPQPLDQASPFKYPVELWDRGVQGEVVVLLKVMKAGTVDSAIIFQSSGVPEFDSAAVRGGRELRFVPGRRGARLLERWVKVPVRFTRDSVQE